MVAEIWNDLGESIWLFEERKCFTERLTVRAEHTSYIMHCVILAVRGEYTTQLLLFCQEDRGEIRKYHVAVTFFMSC